VWPWHVAVVALALVLQILNDRAELLDHFALLSNLFP
jgi:hypothetical protein